MFFRYLEETSFISPYKDLTPDYFGKLVKFYIVNEPLNTFLCEVLDRNGKLWQIKKFASYQNFYPLPNDSSILNKFKFDSNNFIFSSINIENLVLIPCLGLEFISSTKIALIPFCNKNRALGQWYIIMNQCTKPIVIIILYFVDTNNIYADCISNLYQLLIKNCKKFY